MGKDYTTKDLPGTIKIPPPPKPKNELLFFLSPRRRFWDIIHFDTKIGKRLA